jgi:molecular chaperone DnaJ
VNVASCSRCQGEGRIVQSPCSRCRGLGRERKTRKLSVRIPAGVGDGAQIRLTGEGEAGPRGGEYGNLYVLLAVEPHPVFERLDDHILYELPLNVAQAALGARVTVPTVDGDAELEIPAGTQTDDEFVLRSRGVPHLRSTGRGDMLIRATVVVPESLTDEQRELLERLAATMGTAVLPKKERGFFERLRDAVAG